MAAVSSSDDTLASAKAIKVYVDTQITAQDLDIQGDTGGALSIDLDSETLTIAGTTNEIETVGSGNSITIGLPNDVTISNELEVGDSIFALNSLYLGLLSSPTFTLSENLLQYNSGIFDFSADELKFSIYGVGERARLTSTGLGIGITNPTARLDVVNDNTNDEEVLRVRGYHGNSGSVQGITHIGLGYWTTGTYSPARITVQESTTGSYNANLLFSTRSSSSDAAPTERMRISYDGNIGIGSTVPTEALDVNGNVKAVDFNATSDENLKTNIRTIEDPLAKVVQIRGVNFDWKETQRPSLGVIAQEVEKVLPEPVTDNGTKTVNYNGLIGLLIETVKEQQKQIDTLSERLSKLE